MDATTRFGDNHDLQLVGTEMTGGARTSPLLLAWFVAAAAPASAQEPGASFDVLAARLQIGQLIWVTDSTGREVRGRLERRSSDELALKENHFLAFAASGWESVEAWGPPTFKATAETPE